MYWHGAGMCHISHILSEKEEINKDDEDFFEEFIFKYTKRRYDRCDVYLFKPGEMKPRVNFLTRLLKKL